MKMLKKYKFILTFLIVATLFATCKKNEMVLLDPRVETVDLGEVTDATAVITGFVVAEGEEGFTERGICYNTTGSPTVNDSKAVYQGSSDAAAFTVTLTGLNFVTKYYARAYGINNSGVIYGSDTSFTTTPAIPIVTTETITGITDTEAASGGEITSEGGATVTTAGVCWSTSANPTIDDDNTDDVITVNTFTSSITGLNANTVYHVRAYATNIAGTGYGADLEFTTEIGAATVQTVSVTAGGTTADVVGNVINDGGYTVTERGVCYSTTADPETTDNTEVVAGTTGEFTANLTGLATSTTYHVRAYAVTSHGIAYGEDLQFSTFPDAMYLVGDATAYGWAAPGSDAEAIMHKVNGVVGMYWKILHLQGGNGFKVSAADWNAPNLGYNEINEFDATGVTVSESGGNMSVASNDMYMVVLDLRDGTVKLSVKPAEVYGMGPAFGGWNLETYPFVNDIPAKTITSPALVADDNIRMYAYHHWIPAGDWWRAEFNVYTTDIEYRNDGGDQTAVFGTTGQVITLNFDDNTGSIAK